MLDAGATLSAVLWSVDSSVSKTFQFAKYSQIVLDNNAAPTFVYIKSIHYNSTSTTIITQNDISNDYISNDYIYGDEMINEAKI